VVGIQRGRGPAEEMKKVIDMVYMTHENERGNTRYGIGNT
jgi:hypothetical protein